VSNSSGNKKYNQDYSGKIYANSAFKPDRLSPSE